MAIFVRFIYSLLLIAGFANCRLNFSDVQPWGTPQVSNLPRFLSNNPLPNGYPWGNTKPGGAVPSTGVIRQYDFVVTRRTFAPDGSNKSSILINGQFPGPLIQANWGDTIQVTVHNNIENQAEGLTLHWHGQPQKMSPMYDGVPGISQCPIAPGKTFTYSFVAEYFGSSWYHSHYSQQYVDGLWGPLIIYGPVQPEAAYEVDVGPIMLDEAVPFGLPSIDNNFINGRGTYYCQSNSTSNCTSTSNVSRFRLHKGKTHRLRLINASGHSSQKFIIDGYRMTVFANDYVAVKPYETDVVTLGVGQRTDVLVKVPADASEPVWMRSEIDAATPCNGLVVHNGNARAIISFDDSHSSVLPNTTATPWQSNDCTNDPLNVTIPYWPSSPPPQPATTLNANITLVTNDTGFVLFAINNSSFVADYNDPILLLDDLGNTSYPLDPQWNVYNFGSNDSIRIVLHNYFAGSHPMHLHGHNAWVISEGPGPYDGSSVQGMPMNPQRRDTAIMRPAASDGTPSHLVLEFQADNPGVWPLHCHLATHVATGLFMLVMERPDKLPSSAKDIPYVLKQTCTDWDAFSSTPGAVDQIDSGV